MNFRRVLSKSSIRTSKRTPSPPTKSFSRSEEVSKLHMEIEILKQTVESMKLSLESKEVAIGNLVQEKEKLHVELKSAHRTNRNLHQQLLDERDIHSKEKEYFINEIKKVTKSEVSSINRKNNNSPEDKRLIYSMRGELKAKDEIIYNVCVKYLKIKKIKRILQKKHESLHRESKKICETIIILLEENRNNLDNLLKNLIKYPIVVFDTKRYLKLLKVNAILHFENTQLKICLSQNIFLKNTQEIQLESSTQHKNIEANKKNPKITSFRGSKNKIVSKIQCNSNVSNILRELAFHSYNFKSRIHSYSSEPCLSQL